MSEIDDFCRNFTIKYTDELSVPIFETEYGDWVGVGHFDTETFLNQVWDIHVALGYLFEDDSRDFYGSQFDVHHLWAVVKDYDELFLNWNGVTEDTPDSVPVTLLRI